MIGENKAKKIMWLMNRRLYKKYRMLISQANPQFKTITIHITSCTYSNTPHSIISSHYSLQRLELNRVCMTPNNVLHISHYISTASQLKDLLLWSVRERDAMRREEYVHS